MSLGRLGLQIYMYMRFYGSWGCECRVTAPMLGRGGGATFCRCRLMPQSWLHFYGSTFVNGTPASFWSFCALVKLNSESLAVGFLQCSLWQNIISEDWKSKWKVCNSMFFRMNESILFSFCWFILVHLWNKGTGICGLIEHLLNLQVRIRDVAARRRFWLPTMKFNQCITFYLRL